jgi:hypothetical protein
VLQQVLKTASHLTECSRFTGGAPCLFSGVLDRELLKSHCVHPSHTENQVFHEKEGFINISGHSKFQYGFQRIHLSTQGKPGLIRDKHQMWINFSIVTE